MTNDDKLIGGFELLIKCSKPGEYMVPVQDNWPVEAMIIALEPVGGSVMLVGKMCFKNDLEKKLEAIRDIVDRSRRIPNLPGELADLIQGVLNE